MRRVRPGASAPLIAHKGHQGAGSGLLVSLVGFVVNNSASGAQQAG